MRTIFNYLVFCMMLIVSISSTPAKAEVPEGWIKWVSEKSPETAYEAGSDTKIYYSPPKSYYLKFIDNSKTEIAHSNASLYQDLRSDKYFGKRIKISAFLRGENLSDKARLFILISKDGKHLKRADGGIVVSSDWKHDSVVADIEDGSTFMYGLSMSGKGQAWIDDINIEIVGKDVPEKGVIWQIEKDMPNNMP